MVLRKDNKYLIEIVEGITRIGFYRNPTFSVAQEIIDDITDNFPYEKRLWDFSWIKFDFTVEEIKLIAQYGKSKFSKPNKLAIMAPDNWAYVELHVCQAHRRQKKSFSGQGVQDCIGSLGMVAER